jgi:hypothetical protein
MRATGWLLGLALIVGGCLEAEPARTDDAPVGQPVECIGIPAQTCTEIVTDARRNAEPGTFPIRIRAACSRPVCTIRDGQAQVDVDYTNGRHDSFGIGWAGAAPAGGPGRPPGLAIEPICQGVPRGPCRGAVVDIDDGSGRAVRAVIVRCTAATGCSDTKGEGDILITFEDGTTATTSWGYEGASP